MDGDPQLSNPASASLAMRIAVAGLLPSDHPLGTPLRRGVPSVGALEMFEAALAERGSSGLIPAGRAMGLSRADLAILALLAELECDPALPAAMRALQGDAVGPWPCLGTIGRLISAVALDSGALPDVTRLAALGLVRRVGSRAPAAEDRLALAPLAAAALGLPLAERGPAHLPDPTCCPDEWADAANDLARTLYERQDAPHCIALREGENGDQKLYAALLARALGLKPVLLMEASTDGFGAAAMLGGWLPVESIATSAGGRHPVADLPGYTGPRLILAGREGALIATRLAEVPLPRFDRDQRAALWQVLLPAGGPLPASVTRSGPARLAAVASRARAPGVDAPLTDRLRAALGAEFRADMEPQATLLPQAVTSDDYVADPALARALDLLLDRCRYRAAHPETAVPGVRALLSGPSGTGKTMAAAWLATALGLPLFKLDLSTVVSKYIGETEENLARLLDRAETGDLVLLMDEADSLFATRTETKDSSDRFANNQTNYLLSRIEAFSGISILTSNGPERFDPAFARRLDQVIAVPLPGARERRRLWRVQLGSAHGLSRAEINRLAGLVDLAGGHIRNIAQTARIVAAAQGRWITLEDVARGVAEEYTKLGRDAPGGLIR